MECKHCSGRCIKKGFQQNGNQKLQCKSCGKYQQYFYKRKEADYLEKRMKVYVKEGNGIRSIGRILEISPASVIRIIKKAAGKIIRPHPLVMGKEYEADEIATFIGSKKNRYWIAYAIQKDTREVATFKVGKRNKQTLRSVTDTLLLSNPKRIYTDGLQLYNYLLPSSLHRVKKAGINYIERKNLSLRTSLKRLNRRTICFSRSLTMLAACLKIYFWS